MSVPAHRPVEVAQAPARHLSAVPGTPTAQPTPPPAPAAQPRRAPADWFPVVMLVMVGGCGAAGLLSALMGVWALLVYAAALGVVVARHAATARRDRHGGES